MSQPQPNPIRPTIVCLCGSTRFPDEFAQANMQETLAGRIVLSCGAYGHADVPPGARAATASDEVKEALDRLHFAKIDLADEILVVNVGGYVGSSTMGEIDYARRCGKRVRFWDGEAR